MNTDTPELAQVETPAPPSTPLVLHAATIYSPNERAIARTINKAIASEFRFYPLVSEIVRAIAYLTDELSGENLLAGRERDALAWSARATIIARCAAQLDDMHNQI